CPSCGSHVCGSSRDSDRSKSIDQRLLPRSERPPPMARDKPEPRDESLFDVRRTVSRVNHRASSFGRVFRASRLPWGIEDEGPEHWDLVLPAQLRDSIE